MSIQGQVVEGRLQSLQQAILRLNSEIKAPVDERIQDCLEHIHELLKLLALGYRWER